MEERKKDVCSAASGFLTKLRKPSDSAKQIELKEFYKETYLEWQKLWPNRVPTEQEIANSGSKEQAIVDIYVAQEEKLKNWFRNHKRPKLAEKSDKKGTSAATSSVLKLKKKRMMDKEWQNYVKDWKERNPGTEVDTSMFAFRNKFMQEKYKEQSQEVKDQVDQHRRKAFEEAQEDDNDIFQIYNRNIEKLPRTMAELTSETSLDPLPPPAQIFPRQGKIRMTLKPSPQRKQAKELASKTQQYKRTTRNSGKKAAPTAAKKMEPIQSAESGRKWLNERGLTEEGEVLGAIAMVKVLRQMSKWEKTPQEMWRDALLAVAHIIEDTHGEDRIEMVANAAKGEIERVAREAVKSMEKAREEMERGRGQTKRTDVRGARRSWDEEVEELLANAQDVQGRDEPATQTQERRRLSRERNSGKTEERRMYAQATTSERRSSPRQDCDISMDKRLQKEIRAREAKKEIQVLIDGLQTKENGKDLTPKDIVDKLNIAWDMASTDAEVTYTDSQGNEKIIAIEESPIRTARVLRNGGVVMEFKDGASAWPLTRDKEFRRQFEGALGITVKERAYTLIVEFVSTSLRDGLLGIKDKLDEVNGLKSSTIK
ncbi:hypothetical protein JR316_0009882 [Psilocybe cubensis]|uniref:Uncharacterized protein n=1 Tax=Psilocybe cubensis TaxID=181762 RepID=A0ACB8GR09_PSICU|nr:hypothetical protein JR316_0009882 [Psilocybe cubensis]KAH9477656.1 hypothetical protein JR316_0009882 [Psilocybe cubensis]